MHAKYLAQSKYTTSVGCNFDCFMIMVVVVICPPQKIQLRKRNNVKKKLGGYNRQKKKNGSPKMFISQSPEPENLLSYMAKDSK